VLRPQSRKNRIEPQKDGLVAITLKRAYADGNHPASRLLCPQTMFFRGLLRLGLDPSEFHPTWARATSRISSRRGGPLSVKRFGLFDKGLNERLEVLGRHFVTSEHTLHRSADCCSRVVSTYLRRWCGGRHFSDSGLGLPISAAPPFSVAGRRT
jgi:hypothetical protein